MSSQHDDDGDPPPAPLGPSDGSDPSEPEPEPERVGVGAPQGYTPPPSPAYAARPVAPLPSTTRVEPPAPDAPSATPPPTNATSRHGWRLLIVGLALVASASAVAGVAIVSGDSESVYTFGEVGVVTGGAVAFTGADDTRARPLEMGDTVVAGWVLDAPDDATATVELADGGVVRVDSGARLAFVDLAIDPETGEHTGASEPAIQVRGGRVWINPGTARAADAIEVQIPDGVVDSARNPVALDCTATCTVEAPAGGVAVSTGAGVELTPAANEVVTVAASGSFDLAVGEAPTEWAQQNLDADLAAGLPEPRPDDGPGIIDSAILDGVYSLAIEVVGAPTGDPIPTALRYAQGETYTLELTADGSACAPDLCSVPVTAVDGASGTAQVRDGTVALTLGQPIDCYDESYTSVVVPGIGRTTVDATLDVGDVEFDGEHWVVRSFAGSGTVAATLSTVCNAGDTLGTSASPITVAGS